MLGVDGWVQGNGLRAVLPLTCTAALQHSLQKSRTARGAEQAEIGDSCHSGHADGNTKREERN